MAHIARSIELDAAVDTIHQQWLRFEELPRCAMHSLYANVRWRAEVLTFEPIAAGTRITLKIEFDPTGVDEVVTRRLEGVLRAFTSFFERQRAGAVETLPA